MATRQETEARLSKLESLLTSTMTLEQIAKAIQFKGERETLRKFMKRHSIDFKHEQRGPEPNPAIRIFLASLKPEYTVRRTRSELFNESGETCSRNYFYQKLHELRLPFRRDYK